MIDERMQKDLEIEGCDPRNAELFFMAHPGIQFFPNFFQESGHLQRHARLSSGLPGQSGILPDTSSWTGFLRADRHCKGDAGIPHILRPAGLNNIDFDRSLSAIDARYRVADAPRFSEAEDAEVKAVVNDHMTLLVSHIRETAPTHKRWFCPAASGEEKARCCAATAAPSAQ